MSHPARRGGLRTAIAIVAATFAAIGSAQTGRPSATALEAAAYRAIGARHPDPSIRNDDHLAERLLGPEERAILKETGSEAVLTALGMDTDRAWATLGSRSLFARGVHVRTRHIDDVLGVNLRAGSSQVVILGAGLDSRAYRFGDALGNARVFELDLPATQEYKKKRVREIVGSLPAHVSYVPIDFTKQDLATVLKAAGYDQQKKTIFIWEGVTMYIPEAAIDATLLFVARNAAPGSVIVFDYFLQSVLDTRKALRDISSNVAAAGEPFVFGMRGQDASAFVKQRGLGVVSDYGSADLGARYLPKDNNLPTPSGNRICTAVVQ